MIRERKWPFAIPVTIWVFASFILSSLVAGVVLLAVNVSPKNTDQNLYSAIAAALVYTLLLVITLGVPKLLRLWSARTRYSTLIGLNRLLQWRDILFAIVGFVVYLALGIGVTLLVQALIPGFNGNQAQDTGFSKTLSPSTAGLVFLMLVVVAPVAEEIIFRGYLFGTLRRTVPTWVAVIITSVIFGAVHLQWNVGIDVGVMSIVSCILRLRTGSLWPSILLHMAKNGLAFYALYIATSSIV